MGNALPFQVEGLRFDSCRVRQLSLSRSLFVLFCFFLKNKHVGSVLQHQFIRKCDVTFDSKPAGRYP